MRAADGDRRFVAHTIARVAVGAADHRPGLAFSGLGVTARVNVLLGNSTHSPVARAAVWCAVTAATVVAAYQLHHLGMLVAALCH